MDASLLSGIDRYNMKIKIKLNHAFKPFTDGRDSIQVTGTTVRECLDGLIELYPVFRHMLFDKGGLLSALVMLDGEAVLPDDLSRPVNEESDLSLLPMIQGG